MTLALVTAIVALDTSTRSEAAPTTGGLVVASDRPAAKKASGPIETGVKFSSSVAGSVDSVRAYLPEISGMYRATLWNTNGKLLGKVYFSPQGAAGWHTAQLGSPVNIEAGRQYVVSLYSPSGSYGIASSPFTSARTNGPLTAHQMVYASRRDFPQSTTREHHLVDVNFRYDDGRGSATQTPTATPAPTATSAATPSGTTAPTPTPTRTSTQPPPPTSSATSGNVAPPAGSCPAIGEGGYALPNLGGYANACNTGPRFACARTQGSLTTSSNGQVIERICINGSLDIRHDNVTVRDVKIMGTGTYALDIGQDATVCPSNLKVEYTEVNMSNAGNMDWGVYQRCKSAAGVHSFDHMNVHNAGRGMLMYGNAVITNSYFYSSRTAPGAHRTALSTHGGDNFTVTGSTFICVNLHCSSSVNMYSDYAPVTNYLFQSNVLAGGSICLRGGETHSYPNDTRDIRVLNNRFSQQYYPECGSLQAFAQFDESAPGNRRSGNVYHETGVPIEGER